jgi:ABC-2 type transport system permease protein
MNATHRAATAEPATEVPTFVRLLRAELLRLFARRFVRVLAVLSVVGYFVAVGLLWHHYARVSAADLAQAVAKRDAQLAQFRQSVDKCLQQSGNSIEQCGSAPTAADFPPDEFLTHRPFQPDQVDDYALAVGSAVALVGFVLGASFIGAEWSSKNVVAWLFWEPRRLRLMAAKLLAVVSVMLVLAVLAQVAWFVTAHLLLHYRGNPVSSLGADARHFWRGVIQAQSRAGVLVLISTLLGFGLANLIRNTAAAYGVGFVYFAVVESVIRALDPNLQPYLFTTAIGAWVARGGLTVFGNEAFDPNQNAVVAKEIHVSNLHGGISLIIYAGVITLASIVLFRRRDIT